MQLVLRALLARQVDHEPPHVVAEALRRNAVRKEHHFRPRDGDVVLRAARVAVLGEDVAFLVWLGANTRVLREGPATPRRIWQALQDARRRG